MKNQQTLEFAGFFRLAERMGFEPMWRFRRTDFESASLWPLRYLSTKSTNRAHNIIYTNHQKSKSHIFHDSVILYHIWRRSPLTQGAQWLRKESIMWLCILSLDPKPYGKSNTHRYYCHNDRKYRIHLIVRFYSNYLFQVQCLLLYQPIHHLHTTHKVQSIVF